MSRLSITYPNLQNGVASNDNQLDQNFSDIVTWVNANALLKDASNAMQAPLNLYAGSDPTADDHAARKAYVDNWPPRNDKVATTFSVNTATVTSTSYVDWPTVAPVTMSFTKRYTATSLVVQCYGSSYTTVGAGLVYFGVKVGATDYNVARAPFSFTGRHMFWGAVSDPIGAVAAGTYTCTLRCKVDPGITHSGDSNDTATIIVREIAVN